MVFNTYPEGIRQPAKPSIGLMHITVKEQEIWGDDIRWSLYEGKSTAKLYRDWGYEVDVLASEPIPGCKTFDSVDSDDYDLIVCQSAGPVILEDSPLRVDSRNEAQYRFLATVPADKVIALLGNDSAIPFVTLQQIANSERYDTEEYRIKAKTKFLAQTMDLAHAKRNLDLREPRSLTLPVEHVPLWAHTVNWLGHASVPDIDKRYFAVYPGRARTFADRAANLARLLPSYASTLWTGTSREKAENWLGTPLPNVYFEPGTTSAPGKILEEAYNRALVTVIPFESNVTNFITPRMVEACASTAAVFVDDAWPESSAMFRVFPFLRGRKVRSLDDIVGQALAVFDSHVKEQNASIAGLWLYVEQYRVAIETLLMENM